MKSILITTLLFPVFILLLPAEIAAQTNWGGIIQADETLTAAGSPYIIDQNTLIMEGVTLTIEPGTVLRFRDSMRMQVNGTIRAIGTANDSIVFTRAAGSTSGWGGLHFHHLSTPYDTLTDEGCKLSYVQIKHTISALVSNSQTYVLYANGASPLIEHTEISCFEGEIFAFQSGAIMRDCSIHDCKTAFNISDPTFSRNFKMQRCHIHDVYSGFNASQNRCVNLYGKILMEECVLEDTDNEIGVAIYSHQVKIRNNVFRQCEIAIALLGGWQSSTEITGNQFTDNRTNLLLSACQRMPVISGNDFLNADAYSVEVTQYHYPFLNEDCVPIDTYYTMNLQNNFWGVADSTQIAANVYDFYDDFLQQVIVDYSNFAGTPFNTANPIAATLPDNIQCTDDMGVTEKTKITAEIWPNPAENGDFNVKIAVSGDVELSIIDLSGRVVHHEALQQVTPEMILRLKLDTYIAGSYLLQITDATGNSGTYRIILL